MTIKEQLLALAVVLVWGFNFVIIRWGLEDLHTMTFIMLRFLFTAIPMVFIIKKPDVPMRYVALYGLILGLGVWGLAYFAIAQGMPSGMSSLILQTSPFLTVLVALVFFKEHLTPRQIVGVMIAMLGLLVIFMFKSDNISLTGLLITLLASVFMTLSNVVIKITKPKNVVSFTVWASLFVPLPILIMSLIYAGMTDTPIYTYLQLPSLKSWGVILFQSLVITVAGYSIFAMLITKHGLAITTPYTLLIPIAGLFFGWLIYDEVLSPVEIMGSVLILVGLVVLTVRLPVRGKNKNLVEMKKC
ncbi:EamA family transporter [Psychrobacter sp. FDAARGOS_221]|uniref:EamA family transporter n=1 Tax=Psychrobacter sp. FDAARGOS_221 TaxID=1975705 RepID=UPI000BB5520A|nr:EamA family transporter [Psychrobacter sp. FDAARGOS_221]PNK59807.1 hypothetical protein A6J60_002210 [Psychrobacter sp. FDAARGOS_221]